MRRWGCVHDRPDMTMSQMELAVWEECGMESHDWTLADQIAADAVQVLDWYHAVQHPVYCGKLLLAEDSPGCLCGSHA